MTGEAAVRGERWRGAAVRVPALLALTAGPAAAEAAVLVGTGQRGAAGLAPQAGSPLPFGVFHDLRWVFVFHDSWPGFAAALLAALGLRTVLVTAVVLLAWPADRPRPDVGRLAGTALAAVVVAALLLAPWTTVTVATAVTALSWFSIGALLAGFVAVLALLRAPMTGTWWRGLPAVAAVGWAVVAAVALTLGALVLDLVPDWAVVPVATVAGATNAPVWSGLVRAATGRRARLPRLPVVPAVAVLLVLALAASGVLARQGSAAAARPPPALVLRDGVPAPAQVVIYVGGYDSRFDGRTANAPDPAGRPQVPVSRFSYAGIDALGQPLPYLPHRTHQSLTLSADLLAAQVADTHRRTGRPVALLGHSEGTLVVRAYLESHPHPAVDTVVLLSPLPRPGRVYYPPPGDRTGWGVATGAQLRIVFAVIRWVGGSGISPDEPFVRSLLHDAPRYRDRMLCPLPGVRTLAFLPVVDAIADPDGPEPAVPVVVVPERHAMDYGRAAVQRHLIAFLHGRPPGPARDGLYRVIRAATAAWQPPGLPFGLNPVWAPVRSGPPRYTDGCPADSGR